MNEKGRSPNGSGHTRTPLTARSPSLAYASLVPSGNCP